MILASQRRFRAHLALEFPQLCSFLTPCVTCVLQHPIATLCLKEGFSFSGPFCCGRDASGKPEKEGDKGTNSVPKSKGKDGKIKMARKVTKKVAEWKKREVFQETHFLSMFLVFFWGCSAAHAFVLLKCVRGLFSNKIGWFRQCTTPSLKGKKPPTFFETHTHTLQVQSITHPQMSSFSANSPRHTLGHPQARKICGHARARAHT